MTPLTPAEREQIRSIVEGRLRHSHSSIMDTPARIDQLRAQITAVLDDLEAGPEPGAPLPATDPAAAGPISRIPPLESLQAAELVFEAALEVVVASRPGAAMPITMLLHRSITERVSRSATAYVNTLLQQVRGAERAERKRLARELHDRAATSVGVALQSLDHFVADGAGRSDGGGQTLVAARTAMQDAVGTIRTIATELRDTLGDRELSAALAGYLARFAPPGLRTGLRVDGDLSRLPPLVAQELYLVLREAVHNTVLHARARSLRVHIALTPGAVSAEVRDDGVGFDLAVATGPGRPGTGLTGMRDRIELIGGRLTVASEATKGSSVRAVIPLIHHFAG
jgi:signal transduction histidine kinase